MPGLIAIAPPPAAIGTQTVTDNFNRANQAPITGNWTDAGGGGINLTSNAVTFAAIGTDGEAIWNTWASGDNQYSQGEITTTGTSAGAGLGVYVRHSPVAATQTGYRLVMDGAGNFELARFKATVFLSLRTGTVTYVATTKLGLSVTGSATTTLKIWYGGVQVGSDVTDSTLPVTTGVPGVAYSSTITTATLDNWDAGTVP